MHCFVGGIGMGRGLGALGSGFGAFGCRAGGGGRWGGTGRCAGRFQGTTVYCRSGDGGVAVCGVSWGRVSGHSGHKGGWGTCLQGPSVSPSRSAGNDIGVDGCKALAEALKSNTSVTSVDVSCMLVYDWGVVGHACVVVDMTGGDAGRR